MPRNAEHLHISLGYGSAIKERTMIQEAVTASRGYTQKVLRTKTGETRYIEQGSGENVTYLMPFVLDDERGDNRRMQAVAKGAKEELDREDRESGPQYNGKLNLIKAPGNFQYGEGEVSGNDQEMMVASRRYAAEIDRFAQEITDHVFALVAERSSKQGGEKKDFVISFDNLYRLTGGTSNSLIHLSPHIMAKVKTELRARCVNKQLPVSLKFEDDVPLYVVPAAGVWEVLEIELRNKYPGIDMSKLMELSLRNDDEKDREIVRNVEALLERNIAITIRALVNLTTLERFDPVEAQKYFGRYLTHPVDPDAKVNFNLRMFEGTVRGLSTLYDALTYLTHGHRDLKGLYERLNNINRMENRDMTGVAIDSTLKLIESAKQTHSSRIAAKGVEQGDVVPHTLSMVEFYESEHEITPLTPDGIARITAAPKKLTPRVIDDYRDDVPVKTYLTRLYGITAEELDGDARYYLGLESLLLEEVKQADTQIASLRTRREGELATFERDSATLDSVRRYQDLVTAFNRTYPGSRLAKFVPFRAGRGFELGLTSTDLQKSVALFYNELLQSRRVDPENRAGLAQAMASIINEIGGLPQALDTIKHSLEKNVVVTSADRPGMIHEADRSDPATYLEAFQRKWLSQPEVANLNALLRKPEFQEDGFGTVTTLEAFYLLRAKIADAKKRANLAAQSGCGPLGMLMGASRQARDKDAALGRLISAFNDLERVFALDQLKAQLDRVKMLQALEECKKFLDMLALIEQGRLGLPSDPSGDLAIMTEELERRKREAEQTYNHQLAALELHRNNANAIIEKVAPFREVQAQLQSFLGEIGEHEKTVAGSSEITLWGLNADPLNFRKVGQSDVTYGSDRLCAELFKKEGVYTKVGQVFRVLVDDSRKFSDGLESNYGPKVEERALSELRKRYVDNSYFASLTDPSAKLEKGVTKDQIFTRVSKILHSRLVQEQDLSEVTIVLPEKIMDKLELDLSNEEDAENFFTRLKERIILEGVPPKMNVHQIDFDLRAGQTNHLAIFYTRRLDSSFIRTETAKQLTTYLKLAMGRADIADFAKSPDNQRVLQSIQTKIDSKVPMTDEELLFVLAEFTEDGFGVPLNRHRPLEGEQYYAMAFPLAKQMQAMALFDILKENFSQEGSKASQARNLSAYLSENQTKSENADRIRTMFMVSMLENDGKLVAPLQLHLGNPIVSSTYETNHLFKGPNETPDTSLRGKILTNEGTCETFVKSIEHVATKNGFVDQATLLALFHLGLDVSEKFAKSPLLVKRYLEAMMKLCPLPIDPNIEISVSALVRGPSKGDGLLEDRTKLDRSHPAFRPFSMKLEELGLDNETLTLLKQYNTIVKVGGHMDVTGKVEAFLRALIHGEVKGKRVTEELVSQAASQNALYVPDEYAEGTETIADSGLTARNTELLKNA